MNCASTLRTAFGYRWVVTGSNTVAPPDISDGKPVRIPSGIVIYPNNGKEALARFVQGQLEAVGLDSKIGTGQPIEPFHDEDIELFVGEPD
jgi:hypothetical protein